MRIFPSHLPHADVKECHSILWTSGCPTHTRSMRPFVCCRVCCPRHPPTPRFWRSRRLHASGTSPSAIPSGKLMSLNHCNGSNAAKESCRNRKFTSKRKVSVFTFHFNVPLHTSKIFHFAFRSPSRCRSKCSSILFTARGVAPFSAK